MIIIEQSAFKKAAKKLNKNQLRDLQQAVKDIAENIYSGQMKKGDLNGVRVYKFRMVNQLTLIAYEYEDEKITLHLIKFGSHENFYRDLKR
jgi:mRNA-degrading endonuclease RelE of RelBE toxin-antitoxin system